MQLSFSEKSMLLLSVADAIKHKMVISICYKGSIRLIEPHAVGNNGKLRAWQLFTTEAGGENGWKLFDLFSDKLDAPIFQTRHGFNPADPQMVNDGGVLAAVDHEG